MNGEGKYPFEGTPDLGKEFSEGKAEKQTQEDEYEEDKTYEELGPTYKPSWAIESAAYTKTEEQLPYILPENFRPVEDIKESQNKDVIQDNNVEVDIALKSEWDAKVWEAPSPEIGDD